MNRTWGLKARLGANRDNGQRLGGFDEARYFLTAVPSGWPAALPPTDFRYGSCCVFSDQSSFLEGNCIASQNHLRLEDFSNTFFL